jgi:hypothetical protein
MKKKEANTAELPSVVTKSVNESLKNAAMTRRITGMH